MLKIFLGSFISVFVVLAITSVGDIPANLTEPYGWDLPISVGLMIIFPAFLGFLIGRFE